jgi:flavodoxin
MKGLVIYGSTKGNTRKVALRLPEQLRFSVDLIDVSTLLRPTLVDQYDVLLFLASTWGDGELQIDMEDFFVSHKIDLKGKPYATCELGNYYGYDDFEFGALAIMQHFLQLWRGRELVEPFCLDSLPRIDWSNFARWCDVINKAVMDTVESTRHT